MIYLIYVDNRQMLWTDDWFKYDSASVAVIATAKLAGLRHRETCTVINGVDIIRLDITKD